MCVFPCTCAHTLLKKRKKKLHQLSELLSYLGGRYTGKEGTYDRKAAYQSAALARSPQPLGPRPTGAFPSLSELQATS
jgi:hypothetical protein